MEWSRRRLAAWFAIWLIAINTMIAVPLGPRLMAMASQGPDGTITICSAGGAVTIDPATGGPARPALPGDDDSSTCIFCLPLCNAGAGALPLAEIILPPPPEPGELPVARALPAALADGFTGRPKARAPPSLA